MKLEKRTLALFSSLILPSLKNMTLLEKLAQNYKEDLPFRQEFLKLKAYDLHEFFKNHHQSKGRVNM